MQADKSQTWINHLLNDERRTGLRRAAEGFGRWARGSMSVPATTEPIKGLPGLARRGLAGANRPQSAQSIVEFLLVSVPLLALIFGILEFGMVFFQQTNLDNAAREVARAIAICGAKCDGMQPEQSEANPNPTNQVFYKDYYGLRQLGRMSTDLVNLEYMLVQHVGEENDEPWHDDPATKDYVEPAYQENFGRVGPDSYDYYKYHWQLYALPKSDMSTKDNRRNTVPVNQGRTGDPMGVRLTSALPSQIPALAETEYNNFGGVTQRFLGSMHSDFNGWRSARCIDTTQTGGCRTEQMRKTDKTGKDLGVCTANPRWAGRYASVPTDRFYVELVYRHQWITPMLPTVDMSGKSQTLQGFTDQNHIMLRSKVYQKVEPQLFAQADGGC